MEVFSFGEQIAEMKVKDIIKYLSEEQKESLMELLTEEKKEKDDIFLLSVEEYENYKDHIPQCNCWWWLRSPGYCQTVATYVFSDGSVYNGGSCIDFDEGATRPAIHYENFNYQIIESDTIVTLGATWRVLDEELAIAEMPIFFSKFDEESNDYKKSEIRKRLLAWAEERKYW